MKEKDFIRIMAVSPETFPGDMGKCYDSIITVIDDAVSNEVNILLLPELCITSASCGDLFQYEYIRAAAENNVIRLSQYTKNKDIICCVSFPMEKDKILYNVAALTFGGQILGIVPLPINKSIATNAFSEYWDDDSLVMFGEQEVPFGKNLVFSIEEYRNLTICIGKNPEKRKEAAVYLVPDAFLTGVGRQKRIIEWCLGASRKNCNTVMYCSAGEGETNTFGVFSGQTVITQKGKMLASSSPFGTGCSIAEVKLDSIASGEEKEDTIDRDRLVDSEYLEYASVWDEETVIDTEPLPFLGNRNDLSVKCEEVFEIQSRSLAGRLKKTGISKAVIGVSGGIDSTLALLVSVRAMDLLERERSHVVAVSMPCFGTSFRTKTNAQKLCEELGVDFKMIDISDSVRKHLADIGHDSVTTDIAYENAQARERTQVLMDISNMENGLVVGTGDMSEAALGWCTYNGDHMSMYNVNCSVSKTLVRAIVTEYAGKSKNLTIRDVLTDIVDTPVSPELKPSKEGGFAQKTEEIIGPYEVHDYFLYHFIRNHRSPKQLYELASRTFGENYTEKQIKNWLELFVRRLVMNQFKRSCVPDGPTIGSITLSSIEWRIPSDYSVEDLQNGLE